MFPLCEMSACDHELPNRHIQGLEQFRGHSFPPPLRIFMRLLVAAGHRQTDDIGALRSGKATVAEPELGCRGVIFVWLRFVLLGVLEVYGRTCHYYNSLLKLCTGKDPEQPDAFSMTALRLSRLVILHRLAACLMDANVRRKQRKMEVGITH